MQNNKTEIKSFYTLRELQSYIDGLNVLDRTKIYTIDVRDILDEPYKQSDTLTDADIFKEIQKWFKVKRVTYNPKSKSFISNVELLNAFNTYSGLDVNRLRFLKLFKMQCDLLNYKPVKKRARICGELEYGYVGIDYDTPEDIF